MVARLTLEVTGRAPFAGGMAFGRVGPYERLWGRVRYAVDPDDPAYRDIVDLDLAPRNEEGRVEFAADLYILKPVDVRRGNGRLLYDVNNRGNKRALQFFNDAVHSNDPAALEHAGSGWLMRRGYTVVWSGWQGDLLPGDGRLTMDLPVAQGPDGPVTGVVRAEFIAEEEGVTCFPLSGNDYTRSYPAASLDTLRATLTTREREGDPRQPIPPDRWSFARPGPDGAPVPSAEHCYLAEGFRPGWIYELIYVARDPLVMGLGLAAVRDLVSFLKYEEADAEDQANPLRADGGAIEMAYAWGRSQSGRFLREFVYRGFNADARGRRVFDAIFPHVAGGGRVVLNYRFAQPGRYPRRHADHLYPSDQFPFAYHVIEDALTGQRDGILKRPETDPLVVHTQTSSEYWERRGSLVHTTPLGEDLEEHPQARIYLFAGSQHFADPLGGPQEGPYRHPTNPLNTTPLLRALLEALDAWATYGTPPPDSRVPRRSDGTLATAREVAERFPAVPGVRCPDEPSRLFVQDHGPDFHRGLMTREPPEVDPAREYAVLVPQVDDDGNEAAGIRTPDVEAPRATYTGWNLRWGTGAEGELAGLVGSYLPFARTLRERLASGDPRPSLEERYPTAAAYVRRVAAAAQRLVEARLLLEEDADAYVARAMEEAARSAQAQVPSPAPERS